MSGVWWGVWWLLSAKITAEDATKRTLKIGQSPIHLYAGFKVPCIYIQDDKLSALWKSPTFLWYYTESKKGPLYFCPQLWQMLTDFLNFSIVEFIKKFATNLLSHCPPHLRRVATLPCEMTVVTNSQDIKARLFYLYKILVSLCGNHRD